MKRFLQLALVLVLVTQCSAPLYGTITYTQSNGASDLTGTQTCNAISGLSTLVPQNMLQSGAVTGTPTVTVSNGTTKQVVFYSPANDPNVTNWAVGTYTAKLTINTADTNYTWEDTCIIRVNSGGTAQATVGSLTAQAISLGTTGTKTMSISGSAQTAAASDRVAVVMNLKNVASMGTHNIVIDLGNSTNDTVATPIVPPTPSCGGSSAIALLGLGCQ